MRASLRASPILALCLMGLLGACDESDTGEHRLRVQGEPESGRQIIRQSGCGACHRIPGIRTARGRVGPSLDGFARQAYVAGAFPNQPDLLVRWITNAPALMPRTAMPAFPLTEREARDVASFLYLLH